MLRITEVDGSLVLEGRLAGPWVEELARTLAEAPGARGIDVSGVGYVDAAGARLLRQIIDRGTPIRGTTAFVAETLKGAVS